MFWQELLGEKVFDNLMKTNKDFLCYLQDKDYHIKNCNVLNENDKRKKLFVYYDEVVKKDVL